MLVYECIQMLNYYSSNIIIEKESNNILKLWKESENSVKLDLPE